MNLAPGLHAIAMPNGGLDLVIHFYTSRNEQLADAMTSWRQSEASRDSEGLLSDTPSAKGSTMDTAPMSLNVGRTSSQNVQSSCFELNPREPWVESNEWVQK
ncbi:unnamed protein product [Protopolystoma xenopodis]|uniref:Uncharacterized protein n=1 Tax=Protopolystoma xenopodis TaxID=117903 RepID=A0A448WVZ6_9PLAT|nr:unnamed protein product [Protopolystoma xenopodis]